MGEMMRKNLENLVLKKETLPKRPKITRNSIQFSEIRRKFFFLDIRVIDNEEME